MGSVIQPEDICEDEWVEWYGLTPLERWNESLRLWEDYSRMGGSLDPEPDTQSPFHDAGSPGRGALDGRAGLHFLRRGGV